MVNDSIGIDISKDKIDAFRLNDKGYKPFSNDEKGFTAFQEWVGKDLPQRVVYEATGVYHSAFEQKFSGVLPLVKVNPSRAKNFSQSLGTRAKTDRSDAEMLARMGFALELEADVPKSKEYYLLKELRNARLGFVTAKAQAETRLKQQQSKFAQDMTREHIQELKAHIKKLDAQIKTLLESDSERKEALKILKSIPSIGDVLAHTILIELPEIGTLTNKAVAALVGLAPMTRQSGNWQGKSFIRGGRKPLRDALYMPALSAIKHNPDMKRKYDALRSAGKPFKVAIVAVMRNLIILANTLVRDQRMWEEKSA